MEELTRRDEPGAAEAVAVTSSDSSAAPVGPPASDAIESGHATPQVVDLVTRMFADKTSRSVDRTMTHFAPEAVYADATVGWYLPSADAVRAMFAQYMPTWPASARSYVTRIIGDESGAIVEFTDTPELFGRETRALAIIDFRDGKVIRQVDYWDGRHFGLEAFAEVRVPSMEFPQTFGEDMVASQCSPVLGEVAARLNAGLGKGDVAGLFAEDAVLEDLALRTRIVGRQAIEAYVGRASAALPYGSGAAVLHIVGSEHGGGYEWRNDGVLADHGIVALELDSSHKISRFTATWDGAQLDDHAIAGLLADTIER
ncbi:MAG TPA: nuclear transport factor 2 family protein [Pseudonocardiaceae bacterium]|nr:nuclear transport factor 2 family protein [Pseudonocardiaceae bacterium]